MLTNDGRLQIYKYSTWYVLPGSSLTEEGVERIITTSNGVITGHLTIGLDPVFETV